ncbi:MAG: hypothetical protein ACPGJS_19785 [Flammeovirgaceae bacterium]
MKNHLLIWALFALLGIYLSSCAHYASPVPLEKEGRLLEKGLQGTWKLMDDEIESSNESFMVHLYAQMDEQGYNGDLVYTGLDQNNRPTKEYHKLKVFITTVNREMIVNIGFNVNDPDGEYLFAKYVWNPNKLTLFYVNEAPFKNATGQIEKYKSSKRLKKRFEALMNHKDFFEMEEPLVFQKVD